MMLPALKQDASPLPPKHCAKLAMDWPPNVGSAGRRRRQRCGRAWAGSARRSRHNRDVAEHASERNDFQANDFMNIFPPCLTSAVMRPTC